MNQSILIKPAANVLQTLTKDSGFKLLWAGFVLFMSTWIYDNTLALSVLCGLVIADWLTGVAAAMKTHTFVSKKLRSSLIKIFVYWFLLAAFHALDKLGSLFETLNLDGLFIAYLGVVELLSIIENTKRFYPAFAVPNWLIDKLKKFKDTGKTDEPEQVGTSGTSGIEGA